MPDTGRLELHASPGLGAWLAAEDVSLAFTTYQAGRLFFVGRGTNGRVSYFNRSLERAMGLALRGDTLWIATAWQLWRFENALAPGERHDGHDRWFLPRLAYVTGGIDVHDVALDAAAEPVFVSTTFSCLARPHAQWHLDPIWKPSFVSAYAPEDRCHLNGLAMEDGRPAYVTCVARTDSREAWREQRVGGGVVIDVRTDEVVCEGLTMPHSPRVHGGRLWLLNAGTGELGFVDRARRRFEPVAFCPGFLRGLSFAGDHAVVGLSKPRRDGTFAGLPLDARTAGGEQAVCGLQVVDLRRGTVVHELRIEGPIIELFDTGVLPGAVDPGVVGFVAEDVRSMIALPPGVR